MSSPKPAARESVPYGHACAGCSRTKCRCIARGPGQSCERCHRLGKECHPSNVTRKRMPRRPATKVARLEEKLDDLVTLLKTQAAAGASAPHQGSDAIPIDQHVPALNTRLASHPPVSPTHNPSNRSGPPGFSNAESGVSSAYTTPSSTDHPDAQPPPPLPEERLAIFKNYHLKSLPFIHLPPNVTAAELQRERPFLWLNIQTISCKVISERKKFDRSIREILAQNLVVDSEPSLDLLVGLVAYLAWTMDNGRGKKMLGVYSNLAASLAIDLGLDRHGQENPCKETESFRAFSRPIKRIDPTISRTNEERRVVLACFAMCSTVASFIKTQPMRWTAHMENCLQHLIDNPEARGDELLAAIVKISKVMDDVTNADFRRVFETETYGLPKTSPTLYIKSLVTNLQAVERSLKPSLLENKVVRSYLSDTYMMIYHMPLPNMSTSPKLTGLFEYGRTECFHACVLAAQQSLDCWFAFTPEELFGASMTILLHLGRSTHLLYRLSMTEDPAWDCAALRNTVDLVHILERAVERVSSVIDIAGIQTDGSDIFTLSAVTMKATIPLWQKAFANANAAANTSSRMIQQPAALGMENGSSSDFAPMDLNDAWFSEIFNSWEYQI